MVLAVIIMLCFIITPARAEEHWWDTGDSDGQPQMKEEDGGGAGRPWWDDSIDLGIYYYSV